MTGPDLDRKINRLYTRTAFEGATIEVLDVFAHEVHNVGLQNLIEVRSAPGTDTATEVPVVVSMPHAGVLIPTQFADRFPHTDDVLVEIDLFSHLLYEHLPGTQLVCRLAPFFLDMNRGHAGADEPHVPGHLRNPAHEYYTVDDKLILKKPYTDEEADQVLGFYDLYHDLLDVLLHTYRRRHGCVLLIDGHSMTSVGLGRVHDEGRARDNVVVGTLGGFSADDAIIDAFVGSLREGFAPHELGISVAQNVPYSGGFIIRKHHDPAEEVHALQVEVTMDTYMFESDTDPVRRHTIKQHRLDIVRSVLGNAVAAAISAGT